MSLPGLQGSSAGTLALRSRSLYSQEEVRALLCFFLVVVTSSDLSPSSSNRRDAAGSPVARCILLRTCSCTNSNLSSAVRILPRLKKQESCVLSCVGVGFRLVNSTRRMFRWGIHREQLEVTRTGIDEVVLRSRRNKAQAVCCDGTMLAI